MAAHDSGSVPYFPPPPTSDCTAGHQHQRGSDQSFGNHNRVDPRYAHDSRESHNPHSGWDYGTSAAPPPSAPSGRNTYGQPDDKVYYAQAAIPPSSRKGQVHGDTYIPDQSVPLSNAARHGNPLYPFPPAISQQPPRSTNSFEPVDNDDRSVPYRSHIDVPRYSESARNTRSSHHRTHSDDAKKSSGYDNLPQDSKQQHFRQTRFLAAVGGALAGGVGGRVLGRDRYGTLAGAAAGAFGGPAIMDKLMEKNKDKAKSKDTSEERLHHGDKPNARSQSLLEDNIGYYASHSDDEYDRQRRRQERHRSYDRDGYDDIDEYDEDYDRRGRFHHLDEGSGGYAGDDRKSRGYSGTPPRSHTGYRLRARSKSIVDRLRAGLTGGAVTDGKGKAEVQDGRYARDRRHSQSRHYSYEDDYSDSDEEYTRSGRGHRRR